jgi:hypothetical protein
LRVKGQQSVGICGGREESTGVKRMEVIYLHIYIHEDSTIELTKHCLKKWEERRLVKEYAFMALF